MQYETKTTIMGISTENRDIKIPHFSIDTDGGSWVVFFGSLSLLELSRDKLQKIQKSLRAFGVPRSYMSFDLEGCLKYLDAERAFAEQLKSIDEKPRRSAFCGIGDCDVRRLTDAPLRAYALRKGLATPREAVELSVSTVFAGIAKLFEAAAIPLIGKEALIISKGPGTGIMGIKPMPYYDPATYFYDRYAQIFGEFMRVRRSAPKR